MKSKLFLWAGAVAGCFSGGWVVLLAALVVRCKLSDQPFPVLAKLSLFRNHLFATDRMLQAFPILALLAMVLIGIAWYRERSFRAVRPVAIAVGASILVSILAAALNPGGYLSWFLS